MFSKIAILDMLCTTQRGGGVPAMANNHLYRDFILAVLAGVVANIISHVLMGL